MSVAVRSSSVADWLVVVVESDTNFVCCFLLLLLFLFWYPDPVTRPAIVALNRRDVMISILLMTVSHTERKFVISDTWVTIVVFRGDSVDSCVPACGSRRVEIVSWFLILKVGVKVLLHNFRRLFGSCWRHTLASVSYISSSIRTMNQDDATDAVYKVLILGDTGVGKTSLIRCLTGKQFSHNMLTTIGECDAWR